MLPLYLGRVDNMCTKWINNTGGQTGLPVRLIRQDRLTAPRLNGFKQCLANCDPRSKGCSLSLFANQVLLDHCHVHLFMNCLCYFQVIAMRGFPGGSVVKNPWAKQEIRVRSLGQEEPPEKEMTIHPSTLAWESPWTRASQVGSSPWGCKRVGHDLAAEKQHATFVLQWLSSCNRNLLALKAPPEICDSWLKTTMVYLFPVFHVLLD